MINFYSSDNTLLIQKAGCDFDVKLNPEKLGSTAGLNLIGSTTIALLGSGFSTPLQANLKISQLPNNQASIQPDGLYIAAQSSSDTTLTVNQTAGIGLAATGISGHTLTATIKISPDSGNIINLRSNGLYATAPVSTGASDAEIRQALSGVAPISYNNTTGSIAIAQASSTQGGYLSSSDWSLFNNKEPLVTPGTTAQYRRGDKTWQTLNTTAVVEAGSNFYFTPSRFDTALSTKTTDSLAEGSSNFYATPSRVRTFLTANTPLSFNSSTGVFTISQSSATTNGYLTNQDWLTFNSKAGTATNLGAVGASLFKTKSGDILGFRKIQAGTGLGVTYSSDDNSIILTATVGTPPTANAGSDQNIISPTSQASLVGTATASGTTIIATQWTKLYGPAGTTITNASLLSTTATGLVEGVYGFRLTVYTAAGTVGTDDIIVTVSSAPISNVAPTANAGSDQSITLPTSSVTLTGTSSDSDGTVVSRAWARVSGPNTPTITAPTSASTTVTGLVEGTYVFSYTVTDDDAATGTDNVSVVVNPTPPVLDTVYYGTKADFGNPNSTQILAGTSLSTNASADFVLPFNTLTSSAPLFCWFFIPDSVGLKDTWIDTVNSTNRGGIGTEDDLFGPYTSVTVGGVPGKVTNTNYQTQFTNPIRLTIEA